MPRRKPRSLRRDEIDLWAKVVEHAVPLWPDRHAKPETQHEPPSLPARATPPIPRFRIGEAAKPAHSHDPTRTGAKPDTRHALVMDRKRYTKLKRGRLSPESRLDLHGFTLAQAQPALTRFILGSVADGKRLVLVITGKGKSKPDHGPIPERAGALRHQVPHWLHSGPLKQHVLQIAEAHTKHGGQGALYVYLRRAR